MDIWGYNDNWGERPETGELGRLLGQSQQQLRNDHHGMVMVGRCCGSCGVAPGLACSSVHPEFCPITAGHLLAE